LAVRVALPAIAHTGMTSIAKHNVRYFLYDFIFHH
jgi:hypothetical protein